MRHRQLMVSAAAAVLLLAAGGAASAQTARPITIAPQALDTALSELGALSDRQVMVRADITSGKMTRGVVDAPSFEIALAAMLDGSGLTWRRTGNTYLIEEATGPQSGSAAGGGAEVEALIVTAQKREEDIQDVPIAISAFSQKTLDVMKIEGGFDLLKAIPNVTFSKTNFTSYNFSIRGVGTKAISATTDPGVSVSFNNTGIIQNRLFEQEYYDLERVEVLRGPQGTLYGRNATSGVINVISAKPDLDEFEAYAKGEIGNYEAKRAQGMINIPLATDKLAIRLAGALTQREGYDFNTVTQNPVNGRDLWSTRLTVGFEPVEAFRGNVIWEHFEEDDDRSRTGKQLCHRDDGPTHIGDTPLTSINSAGQPPEGFLAQRRAVFSQGCLPGSLYDDNAFGTPNGFALNFVMGLLTLTGSGQNIGTFPGTGTLAPLIEMGDPYGGMMQSRDLREIASFRDPVYRAKADLFELNLELDLTDSLTFYSQTAYVKDETYSFQDYNRFNTLPVFHDTSVITNTFGQPSPWRHIAPRPEGSPVGTPGVFCDPQLGCSDTIAGFDIAQAAAEQFSQEFRIQSSFDGPLNFSLGGNYTTFETDIDYYVMFNLISAMAMTPLLNESPIPGTCINGGTVDGQVTSDFDHPLTPCPYIDPTPLDTSKNFEGDGHNYFRSKNPYELESRAGFGEIYWNIRDDLKLTGGLRYTEDQKSFELVPSQVLLAFGMIGGGTVAKGYPSAGHLDQQWGEWTGRLVLDWKPELSFTDDTLLYASYSHGYKGGGANPPQPGFATLDDWRRWEDEGLIPPGTTDFGIMFGILPALELTAVEYGRTFEPEFVDAFEVGAKNTLLGGAMTFNTTAFYYDYKDYQVSQIRDRTAVNENFDAKVWGIEFETLFSPTPDLQFVANLGFLDTEIADGETSIDIMNRTQGDPNYVLVRPWAQLPSNCVVPIQVAEHWAQNSHNNAGYYQLCGLKGLLSALNSFRARDPAFGLAIYDVDNYPELNGGAGLLDELGGNELPNAPHWTMNLGAQYGRDVWNGWRATVRADAYWQSQSWHRVYNDAPYDKLHGWYNANLSVWFEQEDMGLKIELYAKNILNDTPITDAFLNSDDTALTTNVFALDPRLIGLSIRKEF